MVFASLTFLYVFLPLTIVLYFARKNSVYRNLLLVLMSLAFYAWGEPVWITLLIATAAVDYVHALIIERFRGRWLATGAVISCLVINLGVLGLFKYGGFLVGNVNAALGTSLRAPSFSLPIGISFYTFQSISYVVDVYRGEIHAQRSYLKFLMFVSLFHHLVVGPIVRYATIAAEIDRRTHTIADFSQGVTRVCIGLFKKVCIANVAGELVARYLGADIAQLSVGEAWFGLIMFSVQIYFDFSGYSDMAIGLGWMFGFHYLENFNYPYIARSATEFWRRWHISLQTFFRDYVYLPMGGKYRRPFRNLLVVWFLTGLWHGASWNFVLWGLYFGALIALERVILRRILARIPAVFGHLYLLFAVVVGWALFYFVDVRRLVTFLKVAFGATDGPWLGRELPLVLQEHVVWLVLAFVLCTPIYPALRRRLGALLERRPRLQPWAGVGVCAFNLALLFVATAMLVGKTYNPFLYYRF